jgi:hypothetical protein
VNGPVIVPLVRTDVNVWSVPAGAKLTEAQYAAHRAGNLYVNVHSTTNPGGEIRGPDWRQLTGTTGRFKR